MVLDWPAVRFDSWRSFTSHVTDHVESGGRFIYRGQADSSWPLEPSLLREVEPDTPVDAILHLERECLAEFRSQAHLYIGSKHLPQPMETPFEWWTLMQHYGAPTRLLDWTHSPFVAAYFAVEQHSDREGVVFLVDSAALEARLDEFYGKGRRASELIDVTSDMHRSDAPDEVYVWRSHRRSARAVAQQAVSTASINVAGRYQRLAQVCREYRRVRADLEPARLWLFPPKVKPEILRYLRVANITAQSLFPGLDGLGRSIREVARIGRSLTQPIAMPSIASGSQAAPPAIESAMPSEEK